MVELLILLGICSALVVLAAIRLVKNTFPGAASLAQLSTFYYSVPLSVLAFFSIDLRQATFLNAIAANSELAIYALRYVCLAMLSIELGRWIGQRMGPARIVYVFEINSGTPYRTAILTVLVLMLFPAGIALFGFQDFLQGYATESLSAGGDTGNALIFWAIQALGIVLAFMMIIRLVTGSLPIKPLFFLSLLAIAIIFVIRVKRLEVIAALIPVIIILFAGRGRVSAKTLRVAIGVLVLLFLAVVSATRMSENLDLETIAFYFFSEGLYAGHSLPGIIHRLDINMTGYEYGSRFISSILAFVPSVIWPAKAKILYEPDLIFEGISPLGATTMLTEVVLQGGSVAVFLVYTIMGLIFTRVERFQDSWTESLKYGRFPARFGVYLIIMAAFIPHFRDGIIPALKLTYQSLAFFLVLAAVHRLRQSEKAGRIGE